MGTGILGEVVVVRGGGGGGCFTGGTLAGNLQPTLFSVYQVTKKFPTLYPKNVKPETPILHSTDQFPIK